MEEYDIILLHIFKIASFKASTLPMKPFGAVQISGLVRFLYPDACQGTPVQLCFWIGLASLILVGDYLAGPTIQFPIFYLLPVSLAAWSQDIIWGMTFAVSLPIVRLFFLTEIWDVPWGIGESLLNTVIRIMVLGTFAWLIHKTARQTRQLSQRVRVLEGILPVCSFCKKIRDQEGKWHSMERFITERSDAKFSHGFCPECGKTHYGQYLTPSPRPE